MGSAIPSVNFGLSADFSLGVEEELLLVDEERAWFTDYLAWQAKIVNEYKRPDQFITHDFSGGVHTNLDQWAVARNLDVVATNPYFETQERLNGRGIWPSGTAFISVLVLPLPVWRRKSHWESCLNAVATSSWCRAARESGAPGD